MLVKITDNPIMIKCGNYERRCEEMEPISHLILALSSCIAKSLRRYYMYTGIENSICNIDVSFFHNTFMVEFHLTDESRLLEIKNFVTNIATNEQCAMVNMISNPKTFAMYHNDNKYLEINV